MEAVGRAGSIGEVCGPSCVEEVCKKAQKATKAATSIAFEMYIPAVPLILARRPAITVRPSFTPPANRIESPDDRDAAAPRDCGRGRGFGRDRGACCRRPARPQP